MCAMLTLTLTLEPWPRSLVLCPRFTSHEKSGFVKGSKRLTMC